MTLDGLSALIEGGIPQGSATMLNGSPGTGKTTLALQLLHDHLSARGEAIWITTESAPAQLMKRGETYGFSLAPSLGVSLRFLDAYSWRTGKPTDGVGISSVGALNDLSNLSIKLTEMMDRRLVADAPLLVVFDTTSTLTLHAPPGTILKFIEVVFAKVKAASGSLLAPIERDMHEPPFLAALSAMADGVIDFRLIEEHDDLVRQMRVMSMRTAPSATSRWMRLALSKEGLALQSAAKAVS